MIPLYAALYFSISLTSTYPLPSLASLHSSFTHRCSFEACSQLFILFIFSVSNLLNIIPSSPYFVFTGYCCTCRSLFLSVNLYPSFIISFSINLDLPYSTDSSFTHHPSLPLSPHSSPPPCLPPSRNIHQTIMSGCKWALSQIDKTGHSMWSLPWNTGVTPSLRLDELNQLRFIWNLDSTLTIFVYLAAGTVDWTCWRSLTCVLTAFRCILERGL